MGTIATMADNLLALIYLKTSRKTHHCISSQEDNRYRTASETELRQSYRVLGFIALYARARSLRNATNPPPSVHSEPRPLASAEGT